MSIKKESGASQAAEEKSNDAGNIQIQRDFSNTDRDSLFSEKLVCAMNEFDCLREKIRNRLGVEFQVEGQIRSVEENAVVEREEIKEEVRKDKRLEI